MIVTAIIIVLVILIIANIGVGVYNKFDPPCFDSRDYFKGSVTLPDGAVAALGSIPSGTDIHYQGVQTVETDQPGVIGIKSWSSVYNESPNTPPINHPIYEDANDAEHLESMEADVYNRTRQDDEIKPVDGQFVLVPGRKKNSDADDTAYEAISAMYQSESQKLSSRSSKTKTSRGAMYTFDDSADGIRAPVKARMRGPSRTPAHDTETDGYQDM
jgi:hypothetical protein